MPKIVVKVKTEKGGWKFLKNADGTRRIFPSFKQAKEAACPDKHPNGQTVWTTYKATRID